jgi:hypothetical protein
MVSEKYKVCLWFLAENFRQIKVCCRMNVPIERKDVVSDFLSVYARLGHRNPANYVLFSVLLWLVEWFSCSASFVT